MTQLFTPQGTREATPQEETAIAARRLAMYGPSRTDMLITLLKTKGIISAIEAGNVTAGAMI